MKELEADREMSQASRQRFGRLGEETLLMSCILPSSRCSEKEKSAMLVSKEMKVRVNLTYLPVGPLRHLVVVETEAVCYVEALLLDQSSTAYRMTL